MLRRLAGPVPGVGLALLVTGLLAVSLGVVLAQAGSPRLSGADWDAVRFSLTQAAVSALVSAGLAVPVARALARRRFAGRGLLVTALWLPFLLPVLVASLGLLAIFGRSGVLNGWLSALGLPPLSIYGFQGVVLAHVFLNLPLATRMLLQGWQDIPAERLRLAESLGLGPGARLRHVEWPMLQGVLPGVVLAIFLICLTSFTAVLILGGGPRATTIELAIWQAVRFDFDLPRAALLAALQFGLCLGTVLLAARAAVPGAAGAGLGRALRLPAPGGWRRAADGVLLVAVAIFLAAPVVTVILQGLGGLADLPPSLWTGARTSVAMALVTAAGMAVVLLAMGSVAGRPGWLGRLVELAGMLPMAASSMVLGVGLFLLLLPWVSPPMLALPVTVLVNVLMALPFGLRVVLPVWREAELAHGRLADSLGLRGLSRLRLMVLPQIRRPLGLALGLAAALSMGDLGVIALFATDDALTLPLQVWGLMGAYRSAQAEAAALVLIVLTFALFLMFDLWGRRDGRDV